MVILYGVMFLYVIVDDGIHWYKGKQRVAMDLSNDENTARKSNRLFSLGHNSIVGLRGED